MRKKDAKATLGCGCVGLLLIGMCGLFPIGLFFGPSRNPPTDLTPLTPLIRSEAVRIGNCGSVLAFDYKSNGTCLETLDSEVVIPADTIRVASNKSIEVEVAFDHLELTPDSLFATVSRFEIIPDPRISRDRDIVKNGDYFHPCRIDGGRAIVSFCPWHYSRFTDEGGGTVKLELVLETTSGRFSKAWAFDVLPRGESVSAVDDRQRIAQDLKPSSLPVAVLPNIAKPVVDRERQAQGKLRLGKQFIEMGRPASSVPWLVAVLEQFPETAAAKEAELLYPTVTGKKYERVATQKAVIDLEEGDGRTSRP